MSEQFYSDARLYDRLFPEANRPSTSIGPRPIGKAGVSWNSGVAPDTS